MEKEMMKRTIGRLRIFIAVIWVVISLARPALAEILWSGDVDPANPATWTSSTNGFVGMTGYDTMNITEGSA